MELGAQRHAQAALPPGKKIRYLLYKRQVWTGNESLFPTGIRPRTAQLVVNR